MKILVLVCALVAQWTSAALYAETRILDLSKPSPTFEKPFSVPKGRLIVRIENKVPLAAYRITWEIETRLLPPLPVAPLNDVALGPQECEDGRRHLDSLEKATTENEVAQLVPLLRGALSDCPKGEAILLRAGKILAATSEEIEVDLGYESELRVEVSRLDEKAEIKKWEAAYQAPDSGQWFVGYGFAFIPSGDELYFLKATDGSPSKYRIMPKADVRDNDFAPAVFYSWMPESFRSRYGSLSLAGGLGFDLSSPVVFLGPAFTIRHNLTIVGGLVMHKEKRLNGKYSLGAELSENLSEDQLHEETYSPAWFGALTFRFDSAPSTHKKPPTAPAKKDGKDEKKEGEEGKKDGGQ